jgi:hypothetical protein
VDEGPRVLLLSDDDDVAAPVIEGLRRAGCRVGHAGSGEATGALEGPPPDLLIVDRDLPAGLRRLIGERLARQGPQEMFPVILLGAPPAGAGDPLPRDWHEDARMVLSRPPQPGEAAIAARALLRLAFYRRYRDLVHDLSQPVTVLHALSGTLAREVAADSPHRDRVARLHDEIEKMMQLMEQFQRRRAAP